jgi:hypothetical protein
MVFNLYKSKSNRALLLLLIISAGVVLLLLIISAGVVLLLLIISAGVVIYYPIYNMLISYNKIDKLVHKAQWKCSTSATSGLGYSFFSVHFKFDGLQPYFVHFGP